MAQDRERARQRREVEAERARLQREEQETRAKAERQERALQRWRRWRAKRLAPEPAREDKDAVRLSLRLPDGERVTRRFGVDVVLEEVYAFVECYDLVRDEVAAEGEEQAGEMPPDEEFVHVYGFRLVSPMPRQVFGLDGGGGARGAGGGGGGKLRERVGKSANLIVERIEEGEGVGDDDDDDEGLGTGAEV